VVFDAVASLIDKSLLQQTEQEGEQPRLVMLETLRDYGLECLTLHGEEEVTRQAHAAYYLQLAEEAEPKLLIVDDAKWLEHLEQDHDNLRAAMQWLLKQVVGDEGRQRKEMALRLAAALRRFWIMRGHISEGLSLLEQALTARQGIAAPIRAKALQAAGSLAVYLDDTERAEMLCGESLRLCRELGDRAGIAFSLYQLGCLGSATGNPTMARIHTEEALELFREEGDESGIAWSLYNLGWFVSDQGEYDRARALFEKSLAMHMALEDKRGIASSLMRLARILLVSQGDPEVAYLRLQEGLALFRELGDIVHIAQCLSLSGQLVLTQGDTATSRSLFEESLRLSREIGIQWEIAESLAGLAQVEANQGNLAAARLLYEQCLAIEGKWKYKDLLPSCLEGLANVVIAQGEFTWAARLWGMAKDIREAQGAPLPPIDRAAYERRIASASSQIGAQAFAAAWAEGRMMTLGQVLALQGRVMLPTPIIAKHTSTSSMKSPISHAGLTAREVEVLRLVSQGLTDAQVAEQLVISPHTVNTHLKAIYGKIGVSSRSAATRYAVEYHLL
jgi:ATP/maltotriose-dependent transcriptional regulator MalT